MPDKNTICARIQHSWLAIARMYNSEAAQHGLTTTVGYVLLNIAKEGTPSTRIGPLIGMEATSLTRTLKQLEADGLIERRSDVQDARKVLIFLTAKGRQKRELARRTVKAFNKEVEERIGAKKLEAFLSTLDKINEISTSQTFNEA